MKFIFVHVPKSAGTTLRSIIVDQHPKRWASVSAYRAGVWNPREAVQAFLQSPPERQAALEVFHGHVSFGAHEFLPEPAVYYTLLREPVERAVSHYYHVLEKFILSEWQDGKPGIHPDRQRVLDGKLTLAEYVSSGYFPEMDNGQTRIFAGESGLFERTPFGACTPALLEEAKRNLRERFAVVGLTERFDESLLLIQKLCGWSTPYYVRRNVTQKRLRVSEIPAETIEIIRHWARFDLELYAYGVQLFTEQVAKQGPGFAAEVARFQERNKQKGAQVCRLNAWRRTLRRGARYASDLLTRRHSEKAAQPVT